MKRQQELFSSVFRERLGAAIRGRDQEAIAAACGLSQPTISRWLNGVTEPKLADATAVAHALGSTIAKMVGEESADLHEEDWKRRALAAEHKLGIFRRRLDALVKEVFDEQKI